MHLTTVEHLLEHYESQDMLDAESARTALIMSEDESRHKLVNRLIERSVNILVFTHVEGDAIMQKYPEAQPVELAYRIFQAYLTEFEKPDAVYNIPRPSQIKCTREVFSYLTMTEKIPETDADEAFEEIKTKVTLYMNELYK